MTTSTGTGGGDRLDRFEENMLAIQEGLLSVIKTTEANSQAIAQNTQAIDRLTVRVDQLANRFDASVTQAETDRRTFQAEILRIWEYLLNQNPNGRGGTND